MLSDSAMWLWGGNGYSKLLVVKMLFPGSSYKCIRDLQMEPKSLTNSKQQNRSPGESEMQTGQFLNKEWIFRDFLKFFPKIPNELQLLGKVEVT